MMNHPAGDGGLRGVLKNFLRFVRWFFGWCKLSVTCSRFAGVRLMINLIARAEYHILGGARCGVDLDESV